MDKEPKHIAEGNANWRERFVIAPWAWAFLQVVATIGWLIAIAWAGFLIVRWLFG